MVIIKYEKTDDGIFFTNLNVRRIWERILRVSDIKVLGKDGSEKFPYISFSYASRVLTVSKCEYLGFNTPCKADEVEDKVKHNLPKWLGIKDVFYVKDFVNLTAANNVEKYAIEIDDYKPFKGKIKDFFEQDKIEIKYKLHSIEKRMDVKNRILKYDIDDDKIEIYVRSNKETVRIDALVEAMLEYIGRKNEFSKIVKVGLFNYDGKDFENIDKRFTKL